MKYDFWKERMHSDGFDDMDEKVLSVLVVVAILLVAVLGMIIYLI
jgi:hypothetical protein